MIVAAGPMRAPDHPPQLLLLGMQAWMPSNTVNRRHQWVAASR